MSRDRGRRGRGDPPLGNRGAPHRHRRPRLLRVERPGHRNDRIRHGRIRLHPGERRVELRTRRPGSRRCGVRPGSAGRRHRHDQRPRERHSASLSAALSRWRSQPHACPERCRRSGPATTAWRRKPAPARRLRSAASSRSCHSQRLRTANGRVRLHRRGPEASTGAAQERPRRSVTAPEMTRDLLTGGPVSRHEQPDPIGR